MGRTDVKAQIREAQRNWVREVARKMGESVSELAENAGVSNVTLTRFLNREDYRGALSPLTIEQIKRYAQLPGPGEPGGDQKFTFGEAEQFDYKAAASAQPTLSAMIKAAIGDRPNASPWLLQTTALEPLHYLKGDILICDAAAHARAGDLVVAQVYDFRSGTAETLFRIFEPPYLIGVANDPATRKPLLIDNDRVIVVGPVTEGIRAR